jgi:hypothetical protein
MTLAQLEKRVAKLEKTVAELNPPPNTSAQSWLATAGRFADDPGFDEMIRLGGEYRESLRPRKKRARHSRVRH